MAKAVPWGPRGKLKTTYLFATRPYEAATRWREQFGRTFMTEVLSGWYLVTGEPAVIRDAFAADPNTLLPEGAAALEPMMGPSSLFLLGPGAHDRERKLLMPHFHGERIKAYEADMVDATLRRAAQWKVGEVRSLLDEARSISAEVIATTVFGVRDAERLARYLDVIARWVDSWKPLFILAPSTQLACLGLSPWDRFLRARRALDGMLNEELAERRASGERGTDVLSLLLDSHYNDGTSLDDEAIRSHLRSLLFAGHETTMIAIAWVMHYLHRDPDALERTRAELDADGPIAHNAWLDAVVSESLRVKPIILGVVRRLTVAMQLGDFEAHAGVMLNLSSVMLHSDPEVYPQPDVFRPERFIEGKLKPWEYMPFGGGHRRCVGAAFAQFETKVVVATLLRQLRFEHVGAAAPRVVRRNLSMAPDGGVPLQVTERLPS